MNLALPSLAGQVVTAIVILGYLALMFSCRQLPLPFFVGFLLFLLPFPSIVVIHTAYLSLLSDRVSVFALR